MSGQASRGRRERGFVHPDRLSRTIGMKHVRIGKAKVNDTWESLMKCIHIHIKGQVQGVGFRPFVYRLATELPLCGWVCNGMDGVHIEVEGESEQLQRFIKKIQTHAPESARLTSIVFKEIHPVCYADFVIKESDDNGTPDLLLTPDLGLCETCREEIHDKTNPRFQYPFTTCTTCGPRYSILRKLPYDRPSTAMHEFTMCEHCLKEYNDPLNRRYYSQTNSCPDCSMDTWVLNAQGEKITNDWNDSINIIVSAIRDGKIIAMKGVGGYLLCVDATNAMAIETLRTRKHRHTKPFALLYPDIDLLKQDVDITAKELQEFASIQSPIVLFQLKSNPTSGICCSGVAPDLNKIGVMRPYNAMMELLMKKIKTPLLATSGNVSGSPILYKDEEAFDLLKDIADFFLVHNRDIEIAQDDSVVQFTPVQQHRIVLRRSRGFAPTITRSAFSDKTILALGADMKSSFSIQNNGRVYTSQYLGDLSTYESQKSFEVALHHLLNLLQVKPEIILIDLHPHYFSAHLGKQLAAQWRAEVKTVQHHKAHAYAVLAENNLVSSDDNILCAVWDGTGYGDDGNIWGGEFFEYKNYSLQHIARFGNTPVWLGDKMAKDTRLSALFFSAHSKRAMTLLSKKFTSSEWSFYARLVQSSPTLFTSSVGRLFDAVACLTGVGNSNSFEGESAMKLEALAANGSTHARYPVSWSESCLNTTALMDALLNDLEKQIPQEEIAFKFHAYLADAIYALMLLKEFKKVALSGGVFQNALLIDLITASVKKENLFLHKELSPNDENISFGQLAAVAASEPSRSTSSLKRQATQFAEVLSQADE